MSQHIQGAYALSAGYVCEKKKRGRPRKDSVPGTNKPVGESSKKRGKKIAAAASCANENRVVGQAVAGVIDGSFDAGYFLTVRVGDSNTLLRGVVFQPGRYVPVNRRNDVAPGLVTYQRKRFNLANLNRMPYGPFRPRDQVSSNDQAVNPQPEVPVRQSLPVMLKDDAGLSLSGKTNSPQAEEPGLEGRSTAVMAQLESTKAAEQGKVMPSDVETSTIVGDNDVEAIEELKADLAPTPVIEAVADEPETEYQALVNSDPSSDLVPDQMETHYLELNKPPLVSEPELMDSEPNSELVDSLVEKKGEGDTARAVEVPIGEGKPAVDAASDITGVVSFSAAKDIKPKTVTEGEAVPLEPEGEATSGDHTSMECDN